MTASPQGPCRLEPETLGALPVVDHFLARLGLSRLLEQYAPASDRRVRLLGQGNRRRGLQPGALPSAGFSMNDRPCPGRQADGCRSRGSLQRLPSRPQATGQILTVSADGAVPIACRVASGTVEDSTTHIATRDGPCVPLGRSEVRYVADSKLATKANMEHFNRHQPARWPVRHRAAGLPQGGRGVPSLSGGP